MTPSVEIPLKVVPFNADQCGRGSWLVLLHVHRVPPHAGLLIAGSYNSLTVKGYELDIPVAALLKLIRQRAVASAFIPLVNHPVYSADYQLAVFQELLVRHRAVGQEGSTCLSPVKEFLQEFYALPFGRDELLPALVQRLVLNSFIAEVQFPLAPEAPALHLPVYTSEELQARIHSERLPFYTDSTNFN